MKDRAESEGGEILRRLQRVREALPFAGLGRRRRERMHRCGPSSRLDDISATGS